MSKTMLDPDDYLGKHVRVTFVDGQILTGIMNDYTTSADNDDEGELFGIRPESGSLKGQPVEFPPDEVSKIEVL